MSPDDANQHIPGNSPASRDIAFHLHPYTNPAMLAETGPHIMASGNGVFVHDESGKRYYEGMSGLWCTSLGFSEPELVQAAVDQFSKLPFYHSFAGKTVGPAIDLAEHLIAISPPAADGAKMSKAFFCSSGSEANDTAIKMIWYYQAARKMPQKRKIISRQRGYHGVTMAAGSMTALAYAQDGFGLPLDFVKHTTAPCFYNGGIEGESERDFAKRCAADLEELILAEGPDTVAALFAEPVMGAGGVIIPPEGYFAEIRKVLQKYDVLLVADEVICGFGRTGKMWGSETLDVRPDMLTCAKALSSAYLPISAVLMSDKIYTVLAEAADEHGIFGHGYTYSAHPVCAAVALRAQQLIIERDIIGQVNARAPLFAERIQRMNRFDFIGNSRSIGLIGAIEFSADPALKNKFDPKQKIAVQAVARIQEEGVILRALPGDIIGFCPPLIISDTEIINMFDRIETALDAFAVTANSLR
ncbi:aminotransferase [Alphaproteobacteria bacterium]|jgi:4-aminobutyrate--pyruvate transaminase|nr:aminotransferase [Alphaproteobacteria bacterium]